MSEDLAIIFAYHFPPENVIGALRPFRFYKYLSRLGYRCHVITAADVAQTPELDGQQVADPFVTHPRIGAGWQVERALRKFVLPGVVGTQWSLHAYRAALRFLNKNPQYRATVFSTFPPVGVHFAGYWLSRQRNLPWVADFRDPLGDNPVYDHINRFTKDVYRKLERLCVRSADIVIANTDAAQEKLRRTHPDRADRIDLIWNGFDPETRLTALPLGHEKRRVYAHVGELYGGRSASPILNSLRRLIDGGHLDPASFQVHLAGPMVEGSLPNPEFLSRAQAEGWLRLDTDRLPQSDAHQIMRAADGLLLIQWGNAPLQVPGKLFEYVQIGRPILAYIPPRSPVIEILEKSGVPHRSIFKSLNQQEVDDAVLGFFRLRVPDAVPSDWFETEFNASNHAAKLSELIQTAHRRRAESSLRQAIPS